MTTTKKKAKRSTRVTGMAADVAEMGAEVVRLGRVSAALEGIYKIHMLSRFEALSRRIEALEQAQRPAEKPAAEKRAGPWIVDGDQRRRMLFTDGPTHWVARVLFVNSSGQWHASTENRGSVGTQSLVTGAMHVCDEALRADGWTLEEPPAAPSDKPSATEQSVFWESDDAVREARLRDAVVDAALAWWSAGVAGAALEERVRLGAATEALRAHRAKKGGA